MKGAIAVNFKSFPIKENQFSPMIVFNGIKSNRDFVFKFVVKDSNGKAMEYAIDVFDKFRMQGGVLKNDSDWNTAIDFFQKYNSDKQA